MFSVSISLGHRKKEVSSSTIRNLMILISVSGNNDPIKKMELILNRILIALAIVLLI